MLLLTREMGSPGLVRSYLEIVNAMVFVCTYQTTTSFWFLLEEPYFIYDFFSSFSRTGMYKVHASVPVAGVRSAYIVVHDHDLTHFRWTFSNPFPFPSTVDGEEVIQHHPMKYFSSSLHSWTLQNNKKSLSSIHSSQSHASHVMIREDKGSRLGKS